MLTNKGKTVVEVDVPQLREAYTYKLDGIDLLTLACNELHRSTPGLEAPDIAHCSLRMTPENQHTDWPHVGKQDVYELTYVTKRQVQKEKTDASK